MNLTIDLYQLIIIAYLEFKNEAKVHIFQLFLLGKRSNSSYTLSL